MKDWQKIIYYVLGLFIVIGVVVYFIGQNLFDTRLTELDGKGELQETFISPKSKYKAEYHLILGDATNSNQDRISITSLNDKGNEFNDKTIYWRYPSEASMVIEWENDDTLIIEGREIKIHDEKTYYNYKKFDE
ncbi:DUF5412 family protein [Paenisporosarcina indica]|uniref:DUF5412 family protein n=1 Tax=Paenisporosarcina indica TaxID=650093 RepID=UPI00094FBB47|nr:DUF5412 family protein [Paenisporosarcina indica]